MVTRNNDYVESARAIGAPVHVILLQHVLPNCFSPILVQATLRVGTSIISAAGLSYIGLGVPLPTPEWGALLSAIQVIHHQCAAYVSVPGSGNYDHSYGN